MKHVTSLYRANENSMVVHWWYLHSWRLNKIVHSKKSPGLEKMYFSREDSYVSHYFLCISLLKNTKFPTKWSHFPGRSFLISTFFPTMEIAFPLLLKLILTPTFSDEMLVESWFLDFINFQKVLFDLSSIFDSNMPSWNFQWLWCCFFWSSGLLLDIP